MEENKEDTVYNFLYYIKPEPNNNYVYVKNDNGEYEKLGILTSIDKTGDMILERVNATDSRIVDEFYNIHYIDRKQEEQKKRLKGRDKIRLERIPPPSTSPVGGAKRKSQRRPKSKKNRRNRRKRATRQGKKC